MDATLSRAPARFAAALLPIVGFTSLTAFLVVVFDRGLGLPLLFALVGGIALLGVLRAPHWGLALILFVWFIEVSPDFFGAGFLRIPYLVAAALLLPLGAAILRDGAIEALRIPQLRFLIAIGALLVLSTWWSEFRSPNLAFADLDRTDRQLLIFASRLGFLVFFFYFMRTALRIEATAWLLVGLVTVAAFTSWGAVFAGEGRAAASFGTAENPNRLAFLCIFAAAIAWFFTSDGPAGGWRWITTPLLFFLPATVLATGSRGGLLQGVLFVILVLREQKRVAISGRIRNGILIAGAVTVLLMAVPSSLLQRAVNFDPRTRAPGQESLVNRIAQVDSAIVLFVSSPVLGIGPGNFDWMSTSSGGVGDTPHNSYLMMLTEGGIFVLGLYLLIFGETLRMLRRFEATGPPRLVWLARALRINVILFLAASLTADIWLEDHLYWLLALTIAMDRFARVEPPQPEPVERTSV